MFDSIIITETRKFEAKLVDPTGFEPMATRL